MYLYWVKKKLFIQLCKKLNLNSQDIIITILKNTVLQFIFGLTFYHVTYLWNQTVPVKALLDTYMDIDIHSET